MAFKLTFVDLFKKNQISQMEMNLTKNQNESIANYRRMGLFMEILENDKVKITQKRLINGYILNQKRLVERAREVFPEYCIIPVVYSLDISKIDLDWIKKRMQELGINRKDLIKQLAIQESKLSLYFSEEQKIDKITKAAFFYYFLSFELNQDFRESSNKL